MPIEVFGLNHLGGNGGPKDNETMEEYLLMSLSTKTCPFSLTLMDGNTALITFTGPKNFVSN